MRVSKLGTSSLQFAIVGVSVNGAQWRGKGGQVFLFFFRGGGGGFESSLLY